MSAEVKQFALFLILCTSVFGEMVAGYCYDLARDSEDMLQRIKICLFVRNVQFSSRMYCNSSSQ